MQEKKKQIYLFDYQYNNKTKSFRVEAESWQEAEAIAKAMGTAQCIGILYKEIHIPVKPKSLIARVITFIAKQFTHHPQSQKRGF